MLFTQAFLFHISQEPWLLKYCEFVITALVILAPTGKGESFFAMPITFLTVILLMLLGLSKGIIGALLLSL